ncbi:MAG TPA: hypothetical protein VIV11_10005 [Kofleriaceae bacterium]
MRVFLIALYACGAPSTSAPPAAHPTPATTATTPATKPRVEARAPVDVIAVLREPLKESSWISPGPAQLVLGGSPVQAIDGAPHLEVEVLEEQGNDVRVGVRLDHARFALWMSRGRMLAIIARDHRVSMPGMHAFGADAMQVVLRAGAQVQRLATKDKDKQTRVRYVGAVEVEAWLPSDVLVDRWPSGHTNRGRVPSGRKTLMLRPGAVIRAEAKWGGAQLAVLNQGYFVDEIQRLDDAWSEVGYEDGDVFVHGFVSKRDPPGRTHRKKPPEHTTPLTPNVKAPEGTCLYINDEPIGFIVGARSLLVEPGARAGAFTLTIDTPWGPIGFDAKGAIETELAACGG